MSLCGCHLTFSFLFLITLKLRISLYSEHFGYDHFLACTSLWESSVGVNSRLPLTVLSGHNSKMVIGKMNAVT